MPEFRPLSMSLQDEKNNLEILEAQLKNDSNLLCVIYLTLAVLILLIYFLVRRIEYTINRQWIRNNNDIFPTINRRFIFVEVDEE